MEILKEGNSIINRQIVIKDYNFYLDKALDAMKSHDVENSLKYLKYSSMIAYKHSFFFSDKEIENLLDDIAKEFKNEISSVEKKRCVFYDDFGLTHRMLSKQYISALLKLNYEILIISKNTEISPLLQEVINNNEKIILFDVPLDLSFTDQIMKCKRVIVDFKPEIAFLQMGPGDVVGNIIWRNFTAIDKYLINATDHTFWIGKNCADYLLEFRSYGYNITTKHREICENKILFQPYYPVFTSGNYLGLPREGENRIKIFAGGQALKIYGENDFFLDMIAGILLKIPTSVFYYAGNGSVKRMRKYVKKHHLEDRWYILGERNDIFEVIKRMDIFINTYPIGGALLTQMAALAQVPIVSYFNSELPDNKVTELFLPIDCQNNYLKSSVNDVVETCKKLIADKSEKRKYTEPLKVISKEQFDKNLQLIIQEKKSNYSFEEYEINVNKQFELGVEAENNCLHDYVYYYMHKEIIIKEPVRCIKDLVLFIIFHFNSYYWGLVKKKVIRLIYRNKGIDKT